MIRASTAEALRGRENVARQRRPATPTTAVAAVGGRTSVVVATAALTAIGIVGIIGGLDWIRIGNGGERNVAQPAIKEFQGDDDSKLVPLTFTESPTVHRRPSLVLVAPSSTSSPPSLRPVHRPPVIATLVDSTPSLAPSISMAPSKSTAPSKSIPPTVVARPSFNPTFTERPSEKPSITSKPSTSTAPSKSIPPTVGARPSFNPTFTERPSEKPSITSKPSTSSAPSKSIPPTVVARPSFNPTFTERPSEIPPITKPTTLELTESPTTASPPSTKSSDEPTDDPTATPSLERNEYPTASPSVKSSNEPTSDPTATPSHELTKYPAVSPPTETFPSSATFRLRLYWQPGYMWQESPDEVWFCMACAVCDPNDEFGGLKNCDIQRPCEEDMMQALVGCDPSKEGRASYATTFTLLRDDGSNRPFDTADDSLDGDLLQVHETNLCLQRERRSVFLKRCDYSSKGQRFLGFRSDGQAMELVPLPGKNDDCSLLSNHHHPRSGEQIYVDTCEKVRDSDTNFWTTY